MKRLLVPALLGVVLGAVPSFFVTKAFYERGKLRAEKETAQLRESLATARASALRANDRLNYMLLEERNEQLARLDVIADGLDALAGRVSLCASKSDVRVALAPTGAIEASPDEQLGSAQRDLAEVVGEFARACALGRDRDAIEHNLLVDWAEKIQRLLNQPEP